MYAYSVDNDTDKHMRCKGIKTCVTERELNIDLYRDVLFNRSKLEVKQNGIRSYKHQLYIDTINKIAISCTDNKLFIYDNNIDTLNFSHYKTKLIKIDI